MTRLALLLTAVALAAPAAASAQEPPAAPVPTPAPAPPAPPAAPAEVSLRVARADRVVLTRDPIRVSGTLAPAVAGQLVTVQVHDGRRVASRTATVDAAGAFALRVRVPRAGRHTIRAIHAASPELGAAASSRVAVDVLPRAAGPRSARSSVGAVQRVLRGLGYVTGRAGHFDARTARAVLAFRKLTGMRRVAVADTAMLRRLAAGAGAFRVRFPRHGRHVEADLTHQVMALVDGRRVRRIYPISSGAPVTPTILGSFRIYEKRPGTNALGMVFSSFFIRGYAIHGYHSVPTYPASHGCLRVPVPDAVPIYNWLRVGDRVDVYYR